MILNDVISRQRLLSFRQVLSRFNISQGENLCTIGDYSMNTSGRLPARTNFLVCSLFFCEFLFFIFLRKSFKSERIISNWSNKMVSNYHFSM